MPDASDGILSLCGGAGGQNNFGAGTGEGQRRFPADAGISSSDDDATAGLGWNVGSGPFGLFLSRHGKSKSCSYFLLIFDLR
jgi:hypothetical protein